MTIKKRLSALTLCLLLGLSACEKPAEPLTPPAAMEKATAKSAEPTTQATLVETSEPELSVSIEAEPELLEAAEADTKDASLEVLAETSDDIAEEAEDVPAPFVPAELFPAALLSRANAHICFFSFNTGAEYVQLKRMVQQLNASSNVGLTITEYQLMDSDPYDNFVALLKSGKQCDGVVLSGHHTDEFYGERTDGDLEIEDLEELACDPRFAPWFANVKALWLQGCNTVKAGVDNSEVDDDERISGSPVRYLQRLLDASDMEDSLEDMQDLLLENTNEENLVNDYMRVFSGATVYGWSNIAPGELAGAQKSIPYHLAQATRLVDPSPVYFQNPLQTSIPPVAAERYSQVLYGLLKRPNRPDELFPAKLSEKIFMQAWRDHGNFRHRYSFDNNDIEAFPALGNSNNEILKQLKGLTCLLQQLDDRLDDMSLLQVADYILRDRNLTTYNSNLLFAMLRSLPVNSKKYSAMQKRMLTDDHLVKELHFAAHNGGHGQKDALAFLAALGPEAALPKKIVKPVTEASAAAPMTTVTTTKAPAEKAVPEIRTATDKPATAASKNPKPWYMNEVKNTPAAEEEQVFEFDVESPG